MKGDEIAVNKGCITGQKVDEQKDNRKIFFCVRDTNGKLSRLTEKKLAYLNQMQQHLPAHSLVTVHIGYVLDIGLTHNVLVR